MSFILLQHVKALSKNVPLWPGCIQILKVEWFYGADIDFLKYCSVNFQILQCLEPQCATLVPRTEGLEMLCYNGYDYTTGEAYEGDTCSFTCSSGYELTGSLTRTCQSDGSWSGNEAVCNRGT